MGGSCCLRPAFLRFYTDSRNTKVHFWGPLKGTTIKARLQSSPPRRPPPLCGWGSDSSAAPPSPQRDPPVWEMANPPGTKLDMAVDLEIGISTNWWSLPGFRVFVKIGIWMSARGNLLTSWLVCDPLFCCLYGNRPETSRGFEPAASLTSTSKKQETHTHTPSI